MLRILLAALFLLLSGSIAEAAVCTVHVGDLDFGTVDTVGNTQASSNTEVAIDCDGITEGTETITLCGNIGVGSGGEAGGLRQSLGSAGTLGFALYGDGFVPWGSSAAPDLGDPYKIVVPVSGSSASATAHLHGIVPAGQAAVPAGEYRADLGIADVDFKYAEGDLDCTAPAGAADAPGAFAVTASVPANCLLQTEDLDFGTAGIIGSNIDATTSLGITCTPGTDYSISIDGGGSGDPDHRLLRAGGNTVSYGLYSDTQHTASWGTADGSTVAGTGNGTKAGHTVYGRIPPQAAAPGSYSDTVVVTISY